MLYLAIRKSLLTFELNMSPTHVFITTLGSHSSAILVSITQWPLSHLGNGQNLQHSSKGLLDNILSLFPESLAILLSFIFALQPPAFSSFCDMLLSPLGLTTASNILLLILIFYPMHGWFSEQVMFSYSRFSQCHKYLLSQLWFCICICFVYVIAKKSVS